jgi:hypothetical protein
MTYLREIKIRKTTIHGKVGANNTYHDEVNGVTTLSPTTTDFTAEPVATTVPVNSCPIMKPVGDGW